MIALIIVDMKNEEFYDDFATRADKLTIAARRLGAPPEGMPSKL